MKWLSSIAVVVATFALSGCVAPMVLTSAALGHVFHIIDDPTEVVPAAAPEVPSEYRQAVVMLSEQKFAEALAAFDAFLLQNPTAPYTQAATLNSGRALEGLGRWSDAAERYRRVITACEGKAPKLQATALYRLSFCHEALGDDQQLVAVLSDLQPRKQYLVAEVAGAELPARLAAAYARAGNFEKSVQYYREAERGIALLRKEQGPATPAWLPRTLYYMGSMSLRKPNWTDFETSLRPLARSQGYLLKAAELNLAPWAEKAATDLIETYGDLWRVVETAPLSPEAGEPVLAQRELQKHQWVRASLILENLAELRARFGPSKKPSESAGRIQKFAVELEAKIETLLSQRPAGEGLTKEAKARRQGVRGRTVSPEGSDLERRFLESARKSTDPNL